MYVEGFHNLSVIQFLFKSEGGTINHHTETMYVKQACPGQPGNLGYTEIIKTSQPLPS